MKKFEVGKTYVDVRLRSLSVKCVQRTEKTATFEKPCGLKFVHKIQTGYFFEHTNGFTGEGTSAATFGAHMFIEEAAK